jgi:hypothetical protein
MHTDLTNFFHRSQHHYLPDEDIAVFKQHTDSLAKRLEVYEMLRDQEISLFQAVADQLEAEFAQENPRVLERALKHWLTVMRYCAMAMLMNNHEYLQHRLLEWLTDIVQAHNLLAIEQSLYEFLQAKLSEVLTADQLALLNPFLEQAKTALLTEAVSTETELETEVEALI